MFNAGNIINKLGVNWSILIVTILCIVTSILISFLIGTLLNTSDFTTLYIAASVCPLLIAPPVVYFYAKLNVCLEEGKKNQEELNKVLTAYNKDLAKAFDEVKDKNRILNICKVCQEIRDNRGRWITTTKDIPTLKD